MKTQNSYKTVGVLLGLIALATPFTHAASRPGYLAISETLSAVEISPTVNVNLPKFLINDVIAGFENGDENPFAESGVDLKALVADIKSIRVVVFENASKPEISQALSKAVASLRKELEANWVTIIAVPEDNVGIYTVADESGEHMAGMAMLVVDGGDVVLGNLEGRIPIGALLSLVANDTFEPKELLKKLAEAGMAETADSQTAEEI